jgi:hypothetical protein
MAHLQEKRQAMSFEWEKAQALANLDNRTNLSPLDKSLHTQFEMPK